MGWTGIYGKMSYADEKAEVIRQLDYKDAIIVGLSKNNNVWYAAIEATGDNDAYVCKNGKYVFSVVVLVNRYNNETLFKVMDEQCGPIESYAPKKILNMLSDFVNDEKSRYGQDWRNRCYANLKAKNFKFGDVIKLENEFTIGDETTDVVTVDAYRTRRQSRVCYRTPKGTLVRLSRHQLNGAKLVTKENA